MCLQNLLSYYVPSCMVGAISPVSHLMTTQLGTLPIPISQPRKKNVEVQGNLLTQAVSLHDRPLSRTDHDYHMCAVLGPLTVTIELKPLKLS